MISVGNPVVSTNTTTYIVQPVPVTVTEFTAAQPLRVDFVSTVSGPTDQGWSVDVPGSSGQAVTVTDADGAQSLQVTDFTSDGYVAVTRSLDSTFAYHLWQRGGRLATRFNFPDSSYGDAFTLGFALPVDTNTPWTWSQTNDMVYQAGLALRVVRNYSGFELYWADGYVYLGGFSAAVGEAVELELRFQPQSSQVAVFVNGSQVAMRYDWSPNPDYFSVSVGVHTRPTENYASPTNFRRICFTAYTDEGVVDISTTQAATRVNLPEEPRAYVVRVPDDFPPWSQIEARSRNAESVTFRQLGVKALFNGAVSVTLVRPPGAMLDARAIQAQGGTSPGNQWSCGNAS
jgi:hypothetical protein